MASLAAQIVVVVHFAFVAFATLGGLLALRWPRAAWAHLPAVAWATYVELSGTICPLTPLENRLRAAAGAAPYEGGFVDRYLMPLLYPAGLTRDVQLSLAAALVAINVACYVIVWRRRVARGG